MYGRELARPRQPSISDMITTVFNDVTDIWPPGITFTPQLHSSPRLQWSSDVVDGKYVIEVDVPGVKKEDVEISVGEYRTLIVETIRRDTKLTTSLTVPIGYDTESVSATMELGVLTLTVDPIVKPQPKKIEIK